MGKIDKRVDGNPETHLDSSDISEELKSVLIDYLEGKTKTEIGEDDDLYDGCDGLFINIEKCWQGSR